ncbi:MAG TPA: ATP-binding protein [Acidobacteriota bacterium]|nr:ATP-binding protein [Acidobacteriota bacterium]
MKRLREHLRTDTSGIKITVLLFAVLLAINCAAVWFILVARHNFQQMAVQDLQLQTTAQAKSIEALLANLRGEFLFLSQSPPQSTALEVLSNPNPLVKRWGRLDVEGNFLRYLQARPEVARMVLRDGTGKAVVVAARREGVPVLLPPGDFPAPARSGGDFWASQWPVAEGPPENGMLETLLVVKDLLTVVAPGSESKLKIVLGEVGQVQPATEDSLVAVVPIRDEHWSDPIKWTLIRTEDQSQLISSMANLAAHYRSTIILNLVVMSLTLVLGILAFRQVRRSALLEAENRHQAEVRELERQMLHSERLASVGRLAAGLAHEINNPLEGISNYLSLLEEDLREQRNEGCLELAARVREGVDRAAAITRQVLALSDPGRTPKKPVSLTAIVRETFDFVRSNPAFRHVRMELAVPDHELVIQGNPITLGQVVLNLVLNACEYQEQDGIVEVSLNVFDGKARLRVSDRGPGIPKEALPRIFEPFFSMRGSTGLGLSLCHSIVSDHGGEVRAANRTDGHGAEFTVEIPLMAEPGQTEIAGEATEEGAEATQRK